MLAEEKDTRKEDAARIFREILTIAEEILASAIDEKSTSTAPYTTSKIHELWLAVLTIPLSFKGSQIKEMTLIKLCISDEKCTDKKCYCDQYRLCIETENGGYSLVCPKEKITELIKNFNKVSISELFRNHSLRAHSSDAWLQEQIYAKDVQHIYTFIHKCLTDFVSQYIKESAAESKQGRLYFLELCCGNGDLLKTIQTIPYETLKALNPQFVGFDLNPKNIRLGLPATIDDAKCHFEIKQKKGDIRNPDAFWHELKITSYDTVIVLLSGAINRRVLDGTFEGLEVLQKLYRLLQPLRSARIFVSGISCPLISQRTISPNFQIGKFLTFSRLEAFESLKNILPRHLASDLEIKEERERDPMSQLYTCFFELSPKEKLTAAITGGLLDVSLSANPLQVLQSIAPENAANVITLNLENAYISGEDEFKRLCKVIRTMFHNLTKIKIGRFNKFFIPLVNEFITKESKIRIEATTASMHFYGDKPHEVDFLPAGSISLLLGRSTPSSIIISSQDDAKIIEYLCGIERKTEAFKMLMSSFLKYNGRQYPLFAMHADPVEMFFVLHKKHPTKTKAFITFLETAFTKENPIDYRSLIQTIFDQEKMDFFILLFSEDMIQYFYSPVAVMQNTMGILYLYESRFFQESKGLEFTTFFTQRTALAEQIKKVREILSSTFGKYTSTTHPYPTWLLDYFSLKDLYKKSDESAKHRTKIFERLITLLKNFPKTMHRFLLLDVSDKLPSIIQNKRQLIDLLNAINEEGQILLIEALKNQLPQIIQTSYDLINLLSTEAFNQESRTLIIETLKNHLPTIIKNETNLYFIILACNYEFKPCYSLIQALEKQLGSSIIMQPWQLEFLSSQINSHLINFLKLKCVDPHHPISLENFMAHDPTKPTKSQHITATANPTP